MTPVAELNKPQICQEGRFWLQLLANNGGTGGTYCLPDQLREHEPELEILLGNVFSGRSRGQENIDLARQMYLNWCLSKCRKLGIAYDVH